jgi:hypothetical protein
MSGRIDVSVTTPSPSPEVQADLLGHSSRRLLHLVDEMAGRSALSGRHQLGLEFAALGSSQRERAPRRERAASWGDSHVRRLARYREQSVHSNVEPRKTPEESERVRVSRTLKERDDRCLFDHPPRIHDDDSVSDLSDDAQIVGDQDRGRMGLLAHDIEEFQDLSLDRHVESRRGLVSDQ